MPKAQKLIARPKALARMGGFCSETARRHERLDPAWPKPYQMTAHRVGYREADVDRWLASRPRMGAKAPEVATAAARTARRALDAAPAEDGDDE